MRGPSRLTGVTLAGLLGLLTACGGPGETAAQEDAPEPSAAALATILPDELLVVTSERRVEVIGEDGALVRVLDDGSGLGNGQVNAVDVSPAGNRAAVSVLLDSDGGCASTVYEASDTGLRRLLDGAAAAYDPTGTRLAYVRYVLRDDFCMRSQLVVRDLADGKEVASPIPGGEALDGIPGQGILSWSPDGTRIALFSTADEAAGTHVVTIGPTGAIGRDDRIGLFFAAAFADDTTLFGSPSCCIRTRFATLDLRDGTTTDLGPVPTLLRSVRRDRGGTGLWVTLEGMGLHHWDGRSLRPVPGDDDPGHGVEVASG